MGAPGEVASIHPRGSAPGHNPLDGARRRAYLSVMVPLNIDLGELSDEPDALYSAAHIANIACGGHAGDADSMRKAVQSCKRHGVAVGAHPSFEDRAGFGRAHQSVAPAVLRRQVAAQCRVLADIAASEGASVHFAKPHGALYHACADPEIGAAVLDGIRDSLGRVAVIGPPGLIGCADQRGWVGWREGFADRGLGADGRLLPRGQPGAVLNVEEATVQTRRLLETGGFDTLCVHGDGPYAVQIARIVRAILDE
jgi:UPF0271 protein